MAIYVDGVAKMTAIATILRMVWYIPHHHLYAWYVGRSMSFGIKKLGYNTFEKRVRAFPRACHCDTNSGNRYARSSAESWEEFESSLRKRHFQRNWQ